MWRDVIKILWFLNFDFPYFLKGKCSIQKCGTLKNHKIKLDRLGSTSLRKWSLISNYVIWTTAPQFIDLVSFAHRKWFCWFHFSQIFDTKSRQTFLSFLTLAWKWRIHNHRMTSKNLRSLYPKNVTSLFLQSFPYWFFDSIGKIVSSLWNQWQIEETRK